MSSQSPGKSPRPAGETDRELARGDAWHAFGYLVSGVVIYGAVGWALDRWWGTGYLVVIGILLGVVLGLYATWARFNRPLDPDPRGVTRGSPPTD